MNVVTCILIVSILTIIWYMANIISFICFGRFIKKKYNRDIKVRKDD